MVQMILFPQSGIATLTQRTQAAAGRIRDWLLSAAVQQNEGVHAGAVAGAFAANGRARYVYPEITGYYLHWLAESSLADASRDWSAPARRAHAWSARQFAGGALPQTRAYLDDASIDWRNDAVFFFDFAMLLRGLDAAAKARLIGVPGDLFDRMIDQLAHFIDTQGAIRPCLPLREDSALPRRWSTTGGPFEVKAASRVLLVERVAETSRSLANACARLVDEFAPGAAGIAIGMLHPTLYFAEGMLVARPDAGGALAALLRRALSLRNQDGSLPEAETGSSVPRSDIIAQALRLALQLRAQKVAGAPDDDALAALTEALLDRVAADGSVCFRKDVAVREANVWCSLFAEQALRWFVRFQQGRTLPAAEWLV